MQLTNSGTASPRKGSPDDAPRTPLARRLRRKDLSSVLRLSQQSDRAREHGQLHPGGNLRAVR
ncbi:MAG: hypothetical protein F4X82_02055 [Candidatus Spechtbacteria bacterium SB0662_bin_43]|uniref:Uncharacterized protein n=1 Tax=Candidatus Spechtbacteria bacterium SB0662_bin_43 TaxID=2604897 RepID=A0A845DE85_9BACT|nr:hypothetical protein [Candidatus Spechtbacteria bacterium SB0662_bin_43]